MKATDIPDTAIYEVMEAYQTASGFSSTMAWDIGKALPALPPKVIQAKLRLMVAAGRLRGCPCGCRGDFRFPWEEFGDEPDIENWRERLAEYLKGPRVYGY